MDNTIRCPECTHPINNHSTDRNCTSCGDNSQCRVTPNTIAVAAVHTALYGELTQPGPQHVSRQSDGSWA